MPRQRRPYMASGKVRIKRRKKSTGLSKSPVKAGRPTDYTPELGREICERLLAPESLRSVCRRPGMPDKATVHRWLLRHAEFYKLYNAARSVQCDAYFDEIIEIADDASNDIGKDGRPNWEAPQRTRNRLDARKWTCSKMRPEKYGDRLSVAGDKNSPLQVEELIPPLLPDEVAAQFADLLDRMEEEMEFPINPGGNAKSRIRAILDSGNPVPPELYAVLHQRETGK
jgi:hypothetical protein